MFLLTSSIQNTSQIHLKINKTITALKIHCTSNFRSRKSSRSNKKKNIQNFLEVGLKKARKIAL